MKKKKKRKKKRKRNKEQQKQTESVTANYSVFIVPQVWKSENFNFLENEHGIV